MQEWLHTYKPAMAARWHLLLASLLWSVVGGTLLFVGLKWVRAGNLSYSGWLVAAAAVVGLFKAHFVLSRTARRMIVRILERGDGRCLGGFLSWWSWGFVGCMMAGGRLLRGGLVPRAIVGLVYVAVGVALAVGSNLLWRAWFRERLKTSG